MKKSRNSSKLHSDFPLSFSISFFLLAPLELWRLLDSLAMPLASNSLCAPSEPWTWDVPVS